MSSLPPIPMPIPISILCHAIHVYRNTDTQPFMHGLIDSFIHSFIFRCV
jgi:hypothetical protein